MGPTPSFIFFPSLIFSTSLQKWQNAPDAESFREGGPVANGAPGRATTPLNTFKLDKPLPALPDEQAEIHDDVLVPDFEGYLDILDYLQRDLPSEPSITQQSGSRKESTAPLAQAALNPAPKEDEWMSTRPASQTSSYKTVSASGDELRRLRSQTPSGAPTRSTSVSEQTVTPKSSRESGWGVRMGKTTLPGLGFASRIEEVSEPGTASPIMTPDRQSTTMPQACYHCGRDPTGKDVKDNSGTPTTAPEISRLISSPSGDSKKDPKKDRGPEVTAEDSRGQRYALYPETSYFRILEDEEKSWYKMPQTPDNAEFFEFSSPLARPSNPDPYAASYSSSPDELPKQRKRAEIEIEDGVELYKDSRNTPPSVLTAEQLLLKTVSGPGSYIRGKTPPCRLEQREVTDGIPSRIEIAPDRSFWKNPEGVILVYQGVEVGGKELFYGSDINYLGSFYDDDEDSSGLGSRRGSSHDLVGTGSGLAVIPEGGSSDDLWDDEAFDGR